MFKRCALFLIAQSREVAKAVSFKLLCFIMAFVFTATLYSDVIDDTMPDCAKGTFIQRKTLADVEVTIRSTGRFEFEKGKFFAWHTIKPLESTFVATPTNYAMTVNGKTTSHRLKNDVNSIAKIFEIKEVKDFVKEVKTIPNAGFPQRLIVAFKNGDKLEIEFHR